MHVLLPRIDIPYIPNTKPKKYVSELLLLIKTNNEQDFITWMNWHLFKIGIDHISIYDNESEIPIERLIKQYGDHVSYYRVEGRPHQAEIYTKHIAEVSEAQYVLPIDDDEYIFADINFNDYLTSMEPAKLALHSILMVPEKPLEKRPDKPVFEICDHLVNADVRENREVKTVVNTNYSHYYFDVKTYEEGHPSSVYVGIPDWIDMPMTPDKDLPADRGTDFNFSIAGTVHNPVTKTADGQYIWAKDMHMQDVYGFLSNHPNVPSEIFIAHTKIRSKEEWDWKCKVRKVVADMKSDYYDSQYELYDKVYTFPLAKFTGFKERYK